ncbi:MAG: nucleotide exchange factor GrpE [Bdellovibrionales bacterium]|nr:nucleotide exchange factor GrpE [Bdellovibrionales bacterium]
MSDNKDNKAHEAPEEKTSNDLQTELDKAKRDYLYLLAEFDNYRKQAIKERSELTKFGSERFIRDFLGVFDNFERALESDVTAESLHSFRDGVQMIASEIRTLLQRYGVEEIKSEGETFDPSKHEALSSEPRDDMPAGHVARVFKKAYKMHDKLIRPAQVTVSSAPPTVN